MSRYLPSTLGGQGTRLAKREARVPASSHLSNPALVRSKLKPAGVGLQSLLLPSIINSVSNPDRAGQRVPRIGTKLGQLLPDIGLGALTR